MAAERAVRLLVAMLARSIARVRIRVVHAPQCGEGQAEDVRGTALS